MGPRRLVEQESRDLQGGSSRQEVMLEQRVLGKLLYFALSDVEERRWVARRVYMDQDTLVSRFGEDPGGRPINYDPGARIPTVISRSDVLREGRSSTSWDRRERRVLWLHSVAELLDEVDNPLQLEDFDPCPSRCSP